MMPPILAMASRAITISGVIGMNRPMASPLPRPRVRRALAAWFTWRYSSP